MTRYLNLFELLCLGGEGFTVCGGFGEQGGPGRGKMTDKGGGVPSMSLQNYQLAVNFRLFAVSMNQVNSFSRLKLFIHKRVPTYQHLWMYCASLHRSQSK